MDSAVGAAVAGVIDNLSPRGRLRVGDNVIVLQVRSGRPDRQIIGERHVLTQQTARHRQEILGIPVLDLAVQLVGHLFLLELAERRAKLTRGINHQLGAGKQAQFVADGAKVGLDLARLGLPRRGELVVDGFFERIASTHVAEHAGDQHRDRTHEQQDREQLGRQAEACWTRSAGVGGGRHGVLDAGRRRDRLRFHAAAFTHVIEFARDHLVRRHCAWQRRDAPPLSFCKQFGLSQQGDVCAK